MSFAELKIAKTALEDRKKAYAYGEVLVGETDDRLPKQRFPPAIVRLDNEQLQFHHVEVIQA